VNLATRGVYVLTCETDAGSPCSAHIGSRPCGNQHRPFQPWLIAEPASRAQARWSMPTEPWANLRSLPIILPLAPCSIRPRHIDAQCAELPGRVVPWRVQRSLYGNVEHARAERWDQSEPFQQQQLYGLSTVQCDRTGKCDQRPVLGAFPMDRDNDSGSSDRKPGRGLEELYCASATRHTSIDRKSRQLVLRQCGGKYSSNEIGNLEIDGVSARDGLCADADGYGL
jgi:hypothetical protein